jgi:predicted nucleic acid-binding protein
MLEEILKTFFFHAKELGWTLEEFKKPFFILSRSLRRAIDGDIQTCTRFCKDSKDDMFIQCAIDENIEYIISSDCHLLGLKQEIRNKHGKAIKILSPYGFINEHNLYRLKTTVNNNRT